VDTTALASSAFGVALGVLGNSVFVVFFSSTVGRRPKTRTN
jgi:hypothetical protein